MANDIDHIFIIRQQKRKDISEIEAKINDMHVTLQNKIQCSKDIEKIQEYNGLKLSFQNLHSECKERENEIDNLHKQICYFQSSTLQNEEQDLRTRYKEAQRKEIKMKKKLSLLKEDLKLQRMSSDDAHAYLLNKVKSNEGKIVDMGKVKAKLDESIINMRKLSAKFKKMIMIKTNEQRVH